MEKEKDKYEDFILASFKKADNAWEPIEGKFPPYLKFVKLQRYIMLAVSRYYIERHQHDPDPEEAALDEFFDDYDLWVGEKDRREKVNYYLSVVGRPQKEDPLMNRMIDAMFGYFDGERHYDGSSYFKGMRDGLGDNPCPEHKAPDSMSGKKGGKC